MTSKTTRLRAGEALARFSSEHDIPVQDLPAEATLAKLRCYGGGPSFVKPKPSVVLYDYSVFEEWLLARMTPKVSTAGDAVARRSTSDAA
jgi:hypothetical protein